ncbi:MULTISPECIES: LPS export ABC transporter periplasmic protein LptC [unclassified Oceanobacter]|jgi:LPS export ABC transporter protein LptC|uniref:LPS export ABC transporter periplasmic protein LptC n=1 Tax=unclassified Oceanobacter TaxID=2620260 RepID=UPI002734DCA7|nr:MULTISPECIES: LPS export ABC transporter periplasmic protein LptC [unclassified Oceanobacter]MDP2505345.1 LPS export ABC transporter periplasmic protein LptC [Oceanobacter sp. 3_MG-2023]MDP2610127.1 LPS export ABC transporter periplasmic protein LptC [Oceanobacter sp. 1_MG-2023]MDP2612298.1 LPS export ABC transporter periplasmic protein LptC [Oceanobacter sp. 2_MG-2023]
MRKRYVLLVLAVAVGLALLAVERYTTELVTAATPVTSLEPDYYGKQLQHRRYDADGQLQQMLSADGSRHIPSLSETRLENPVITTQTDPQQHWQVSAQSGRIMDTDSQVELSQQVEVRSLATAAENADTFSITTSLLLYQPASATASTSEPVIIRHGNNITHATGMTLDIKRQHLDLQAHVSTRYVQ